MGHRIRRTAAALVVAVALIVSGCSAAWIDTAIADLPVVLQIVTSILSIADVALIPEAQAKGAETKADLELLKQLVADYKSAKDANAQKTALAAVQAALSASSAHLSELLAAIHVKNQKDQVSIATGVAVALSVLVAVQSLLPGNAAKVSRAVHLDSPKALKRRFNSAIAGSYPSAVLK